MNWQDLARTGFMFFLKSWSLEFSRCITGTYSFQWWSRSLLTALGYSCEPTLIILSSSPWENGQTLRHYPVFLFSWLRLNSILSSYLLWSRRNQRENLKEFCGKIRFLSKESHLTALYSTTLLSCRRKNMIFRFFLYLIWPMSSLDFAIVSLFSIFCKHRSDNIFWIILQRVWIVAFQTRAEAC